MRKFIIVSRNKRLEVIRLDDVILFKGQRNYIEIVLKDKSRRCHPENLAWAERNVKCDNFFRLHKSFIINFDYISNIEYDKLKVYTTNNEEVPLSRYRKKLFRERFNSYNE